MKNRMQFFKSENECRDYVFDELIATLQDDADQCLVSGDTEQSDELLEKIGDIRLLYMLDNKR